MDDLQDMESIKSVVTMLRSKMQKMETQLQSLTSENVQLKLENKQLASNSTASKAKPNISSSAASSVGKDNTKFNVNDIIYHLKHSPGFKPPYITIDIQKELEEILQEDNENV